MEREELKRLADRPLRLSFEEIVFGRGGRNIEILPRHWASYDRGLAIGIYLHDAVNLVTMEEWTKRPDEGATRQLAV